jgi:acetyl-CoA C-acetyltransferase
MPRKAFIVAGARTPFAVWKRARSGSGARGGALAGFLPSELATAACRAVLERAGSDPGEIDRLVFGNMYQVGPHACYGGRYVALRSGLSPQTPSIAVNMACGTGLAALIHAAREIEGEHAETALCAGADCPSRIEKDIFVPSFFDEECGQEIGAAVEALAKERGIDRAAMDAWAIESHRRAGAARAAAGEEIVPVGDSAYGGAVTARNTHAIVDGGTALLLSSRDRESALGRFVDGVAIGIEPERMGYASVPAIRSLLKRAGLGVDDIDLFEINETFAAQLLLDIGELRIPPERVNVNGGAVAIGHPFAATGGKLVLGLLLELRRRGLKRGIAAVCIGGGQGVAVLVERL